MHQLHRTALRTQWEKVIPTPSGDIDAAFVIDGLWRKNKIVIGASVFSTFCIHPTWSSQTSPVWSVKATTLREDLGQGRERG
jgi:hypothetical protein